MDFKLADTATGYNVDTLRSSDLSRAIERAKGLLNKYPRLSAVTITKAVEGKEPRLIGVQFRGAFVDATEGNKPAIYVGA